MNFIKLKYRSAMSDKHLKLIFKIRTSKIEPLFNEILAENVNFTRFINTKILLKLILKVSTYIYRNYFLNIYNYIGIRFYEIKTNCVYKCWPTAIAFDILCGPQIKKTLDVYNTCSIFSKLKEISYAITVWRA